MKEKISSLQIGAIIWQIILSSFIGIVPYILFLKLKQNSWNAIVISFLLGFLVIGLYLYIMNKLPDKNIFEKIEFAFGKIIGKIINAILVIGTLYMTILYFYHMINFITSQYLIKTPNLFVILIFTIPILYLITQKLEVIGRTAFVFWIVSAFLFFLTFCGLVYQLDLSKIFPLFEYDAKSIFTGTLLCIPYTQFVTFLFTAIPKNKIIDKQNLNKRFLLFYILAYTIMFIGNTFITMSLGGALAQIYQYPEYQVLKRVSLVGFIERIESTLSIRWVLYMITTAIMGLYFTKVYCKFTFKIKSKENWVIGIITVVALFLSNWLYPNTTAANQVIIEILPYGLYSLYLGVPLLLAILLKFKKA